MKSSLDGLQSCLEFNPILSLLCKGFNDDALFKFHLALQGGLASRPTSHTFCLL